MKKYILLMLISLLSLCLFSCDKDEKEEDVLEGYEKSTCLVDFENKDLDKVSTKRTFANEKITNECSGDELVPYQIFGNGMCLQRDCVNKIWGYTTGNYICVELDGKSYYGTVSDEEFTVYLPMRNAGGPYEMSIVSEVGRITYKDVYFGEVYLASGQSNMEWRVSWSGSTMSDLYSDSEACINRNIRFLDLTNTGNTKTPTTKVSSGMNWDFARSQLIMRISANAYLFAKNMQEELNVPIGIISTAVGGSILEYWLSDEAYNELKKEATCVVDTNNKLFTPSIGYNGLIYPLLGYNFRGVIWYQGCSNTIGSQGSYGVALSKLISSWRKDFNNPNMTFTVFELARFNENPVGYSTINEKITEVSKKDDKVCYVANLDLGDWNNIHPQDKRVIAKRASDITLKEFYGYDKPVCPEYVSHEVIDNNTIKITFTRDIEQLNGNNGFEVLTKNGYSYNCSITVSSNVVTVTSSEEIIGVRYGYRANMTDDMKKDVSKMVTLYASSKDHLPVNLFKIELEK